MKSTAVTKTLSNKQIVLGVSGSIAAYKAPDIVRRLMDLGAQVRVILTEGGAKFITELSLQTTSKNKVLHSLWNAEDELSIGHIELAKWADLILIAPASANVIANLSAGSASDLLSNVVLASDCPLLVAPAMNPKMYASKALKDNISQLVARHIQIIAPEYGEQACGDMGVGNLAEPKFIAQQAAMCFTGTKLTGKKVLITLGATVEALDPVRYLSNRSSGKMGMALAMVCTELGAEVTLVCANISVPIIDKVVFYEAYSAQQMHKTVLEHIRQQDIFISCAAVSDYRAKTISKQKIKKGDKALEIELIPNPDILFEVSHLAQKPICIGFAAETQNLIKNAQKKLKTKGCDAMILNDVSKADFGFGKDSNEVVFLDSKSQTKIANNSKQKVARKIIQIMLRKFL